MAIAGKMKTSFWNTKGLVHCQVSHERRETHHRFDNCGWSSNYSFHLRLINKSTRKWPMPGQIRTVHSFSYAQKRLNGWTENMSSLGGLLKEWMLFVPSKRSAQRYVCWHWYQLEVSVDESPNEVLTFCVPLYTTGLSFLFWLTPLERANKKIGEDCGLWAVGKVRSNPEK